MTNYNTCKLCLVEGRDKRTLRINCSYDIKEVVPEATYSSEQGFILRICKACRAALLGKLESWREERIAQRDLPMDEDGNSIGDPDRNIPVRVNGVIKMFTEKEFIEYESNCKLKRLSQ